jgi:hypothetical protein
MAAVLLMPAFGVAVDQLARIGAPAVWAARLLLMGSVAMNIAGLHTNGNYWATRAADERNVLELVAASPATATVDQSIAPLPFSPDLRISDIAVLVADGAIHPRAPASVLEQALVTNALSQPVPP